MDAAGAAVVGVLVLSTCSGQKHAMCSTGVSKQDLREQRWAYLHFAPRVHLLLL